MGFFIWIPSCADRPFRCWIVGRLAENGKADRQTDQAQYSSSSDSGEGELLPGGHAVWSGNMLLSPPAPASFSRLLSDLSELCAIRNASFAQSRGARRAGDRTGLSPHSLAGSRTKRQSDMARRQFGQRFFAGVKKPPSKRRICRGALPGAVEAPEFLAESRHRAAHGCT